MILFLVFLLLVALTFVLFYLRLRCLERRLSEDNISFFHPYCNAGGGGERVLWQCVLGVTEQCPGAHLTVYTGDVSATPEEIFSSAERCFGISLPRDRVSFVFLRWRCLVEAKFYPVLTLLGQSLGSVLLGFEALWRHPTGYWVDTMGYAFTYPLAYLCGCDVVSYVHYPTISTDMLGLVRDRKSTYNNSSLVASIPLLSGVKIMYYKLFAWVYGAVGRLSSVIFVNSTWTENHIREIWGSSDRIYKLYPPCNTTNFLKIRAGSRQRKILSLAQFRPEKNHRLQIESFAKFMEGCPERDVKLVLVGGVRDEGDKARVKQLQNLTHELGLSDVVEFKVGIPYEELLQEISTSLIGLHTMWNEHFGIGIVEFMAAGLVPLAHNSGGPKLDIVLPGCGFLAATADEYSRHINRVLAMSDVDHATIISRARDHVKSTFSDENFRSVFVEKTRKHLEEFDFMMSQNQS